MNAVSFSEASENLEAMVDKVVADRAPPEGGDGAALLSAGEWASIKEMLQLNGNA